MPPNAESGVNLRIRSFCSDKKPGPDRLTFLQNLKMASTFPDLKIGEVVACLCELGVSVNDEQISKPSSEHIIRVMEQFLDIFMGYTAEDNAQIKFEGMDVFDYPEIHEFSVGQLAFYRSL